MKLEQLGWNAFFEAAWNSIKHEGLRPSRVIAQHREVWEIAGLFGECHADASGHLRLASEKGGDWPAVGDWVAVSGEVGRGMTIREVLLRRTQIVRKVPGKRNEPQVLAANVDTIFLVMGLDGDYNPRRLERYLVQVWDSGARPVVLLNKGDICEDAELSAANIRRHVPGVNVHCISATIGVGLDALTPYLAEGATVVLLGSSGVGKSTLVNRLLETEQQSTHSARKRDGRGRHTTTVRQLFFLSAGAMVIDSPGLRELQLWGVEQGLDSVFHELEVLARDCRFRNCSHSNEPGCAVKLALEQGKLDEKRLENHRKLQREQQFLQRKVDTNAQQEAKQHIKQINRAMRRLFRQRDRL